MFRACYVYVSFLISTFMLLSVSTVEAQDLPRCLHVMSYHQGYAWNDGIEEGVERILNGKCALKKFYMDSKRNSSPKFIQNKALQAKALIEDYQPNIVIASDDNASRYLVQVFYKNAELPFVFAGINWTAEPYDYPYKNATGMVEVAPILTMLEIAQRNAGNIRDVVFLSADVLTEHKDYKHYINVYEPLGIKVKGIFAKNMREWEAGFIEAQKGDIIILGNNAGVNDWDNARAERRVNKSGKKLTMTTYKWMMPFTMLGVSKVAAEQGEWAAEVALEILAGTAVSEIPVTINRRWLFFRNKPLLESAGIRIDSVTRKKTISKQWSYE